MNAPTKKLVSLKNGTCFLNCVKGHFMMRNVTHETKAFGNHPSSLLFPTLAHMFWILMLPHVQMVTHGCTLQAVGFSYNEHLA